MSASARELSDTLDNPMNVFVRRDGVSGTAKVRRVHGPITVVIDKRGRLKVKPVTVKWGATFPDGSQQLGWSPGRAGEASSVVVSEEGIAWIKGHHRPGSPQVKALLAAYALGTTS